MKPIPKRVRSAAGAKRTGWVLAGCVTGLMLLLAQGSPAGQGSIVRATASPLITLTDGSSNLVLRLNLSGRCVLDQVFVCGRSVVGPQAVATGVCLANEWFTTASNLPPPNVSLAGNTVTVSAIHYGPAHLPVEETWNLTVQSDQISWQITRRYLAAGKLEDTCFPGWHFATMDTWTGGILDDGGVAWNKYLDRPNASYGAHVGAVTFWNAKANDYLCISSAVEGASAARAVRFSQDPSGAHMVAFSVSDQELSPRHDLRRFLASSQDLWAAFPVAASTVTVTYSLRAGRYDERYDLGSFCGVNGRSIRELLNTIGRYGVIDNHLLGGNGWRSGFFCLHEPWFAQMGLPLADPNYLANCAAAFDYERDHAILPDGRVKARWWYVPGDAMPGTYDALGFYEAQWGYLLDSQPCFAITVAELFDLTGDGTWLRGQKIACERALAYLLKRDRDGNGLVEMMTGSHTQQRGSDWIDIIWAAHENALVNAELYYALTLWADLEDLLKDSTRAAEYRHQAARLKAAFNRPTTQGGFWDEQHQWYAYWRDRDGSVHGNNLVTPVNFAAISYGLCDDPVRRRAILQRIEEQMQHEHLFLWPLNFFPYAPDEGHANNFPFPRYENGDIFLSWGELAVRAYAQEDPATAMKYVRNVLEKYETDGLSFQRYERNSQRGSGDDILAGNCLTIVGLYRDIFGLQPKHDRLYLEPHLTAELSGTQLHYQLRGQAWNIDLETKGSQLATQGFALRCRQPFALRVQPEQMEFFPRQRTKPALELTRSGPVPVSLEIESWPEDPRQPRRWTASSSGRLRHVVSDLVPRGRYQLLRDGRPSGSVQADASGKLEFKTPATHSSPHRLEVRPE